MDERSATLTTGEVIPTRTVCWTTGVRPPAVVRELGLPLDPHDERIVVDATMRVRGWRTSGRSATPPPYRTRLGAARGPVPRRLSTRSARASGGRQRGRRPRRPQARAAFATARSACSSTWGRQGGGDDARRAPAWLRRLVRGPHLPHADDARVRPPAEARGRLDGWTVLRPRVGRARTARPSAFARHLSRARGGAGSRRRAASSRSARGVRATCERRSSSPSARCSRAGAAAASWCPATTIARPPARGVARQQPLLEFIAAQPEGQFFVCESGNEIVGYARVARFGQMDELSELAVRPSTPGEALGAPFSSAAGPSRRAPGWAGRPDAGMPVDLSLYTGFGVMPVTGHWHLRHRSEGYLERRSQELVDSGEPRVHALTVGARWPSGSGSSRRRSGTSARSSTSSSAALAAASRTWTRRAARRWRSAGSVPALRSARPWEPPRKPRAGGAGGARPGGKAQEPETLGVFCTTDSWWLLDRLRRLGFHVYWPSWVMCSVPLPGLDRYLRDQPARVL